MRKLWETLRLGIGAVFFPNKTIRDIHFITCEQGWLNFFQFTIYCAALYIWIIKLNDGGYTWRLLGIWVLLMFPKAYDFSFALAAFATNKLFGMRVNKQIIQSVRVAPLTFVYGLLCVPFVVMAINGEYWISIPLLVLAAVYMLIAYRNIAVLRWKAAGGWGVAAVIVAVRSIYLGTIIMLPILIEMLTRR